MKGLGCVLGGLGGAALGVSAVILFVMACSLVAGESDSGLWLAGLGTAGGAIGGAAAGIAIAARRRGPPTGGAQPPTP